MLQNNVRSQLQRSSVTLSPGLPCRPGGRVRAFRAPLRTKEISVNRTFSRYSKILQESSGLQSYSTLHFYAAYSFSRRVAFSDVSYVRPGCGRFVDRR